MPDEYGPLLVGLENGDDAAVFRSANGKETVITADLLVEDIDFDCGDIVQHFSQATDPAHPVPDDARDLPKPVIGYYGVIDERIDLDLLDKVAAMRPEWQLVMVGPVVKISEEDLPRRENIHYLGGKSYDELPTYLGNWDVAMMPFAINEATRFISPTKTPEYLAGGKPVVSTPVRDVVRHYGHLEGVKIAATPDEFVAACEQALELSRNPESGWLAEADLMLSASSWDTTQARMSGLIADVLGIRSGANPALLVAAE